VAISILGESRKKRLLPIACMTRRLRHFAPRSDNAEDRELEGVSNVMELYTNLTNGFEIVIINLAGNQLEK
jgi:hypothetical protein